MTPRRIRNTLIAAFGIVLLLVACALDRTAFATPREIMFNIAIIIVSVSLIDILWHVAGGNPVEDQIKDLSAQVERLSTTVDVIENARRVGVHSLYDNAGDFGGKTQWFALMESATKSMDLMGRTLYEWIRAPEFDEILLRKIERDGVQFRWLIMSLDNRHLDQLEEDGERIGGSIKRKIKPVLDRLMSIRGRLSPAKRNLLQARTFSQMPLYASCLIVDDQYLIVPYLHSVESRNSPLFILHGRGLPWAIAYDREFDMVWNTATDIFTGQIAGFITDQHPPESEPGPDSRLPE